VNDNPEVTRIQNDFVGKVEVILCVKGKDVQGSVVLFDAHLYSPDRWVFVYKPPTYRTEE
jgi:hypothetical protein